MNKNYMTITEAAKMLGISTSTLRRLEKDGKVEGYGLNVYHTPGGQRRYSYNELEYAYRKWGVFGKIGYGKKPCIIVRDLIRAFTDPGSKSGYSSLSKVISNTKIMLKHAAESSIPVIFAITYYDPENPFSQFWASKIETNQMLLKDSIWTEIDPQLKDYPYHEIIYSPYISPFFNTELTGTLRSLDIDTLLIVGNSTSGCIRVTAIDALQNGFRPIIPKEAVMDRSEISHETALVELDAKYADIVTMEDAIQYFNSVS
jgi:maleamate amidohydrolase